MRRSGWTEGWAKEWQAACDGRVLQATLAAVSPPSKYRNVRTAGPNPLGGERIYSSKREAMHAAYLAHLKRMGELADWFPQVSFEYGEDERGGRTRYVADFMEVLEYRPDGTFVARLTDAKGIDTPASKAKRAALKGRGMQVRIV